MFKVFERRSVELVGAFRIWRRKLFASSTVQKPGCRRFEESQRGSLKNQSISDSGGKRRRSWRGREERKGVKPKLIKISIITTLIDAAECHM